MAHLHSRLEGWPVDDVLTELRQKPEWEQARLWGWIMESGELIGIGHVHAKTLPSGLLRPDGF